MKRLYFLFPTMNLQSGGHLAQIKLFEIAQSLMPSTAVTYESRYEDFPFLDDLLLENDKIKESVFFVHWGPHVPTLLQRLADKNVVYVAYSTGYAFSIPPGVPILAASRHAMAYWGRYAPASPIYYLPPEISSEFTNYHQRRDIDVLVQKRKSSHYLMDELVPLLSQKCRVVVLESWVSSLAQMFNRSKVYLYDSVEYWRKAEVSEGFGLPPLEALACGCTVFSSLNDGLSDYLDPGFNCFQIRSISAEHDAERILKAVQEWQDMPSEPSWLGFYRRENIRKRFERILGYLEEYYIAREKFPLTELSLALSAAVQPALPAVQDTRKPQSQIQKLLLRFRK